MTARDALSWMEDQAASHRRVLFRGQNRVYPSIRPSMARLDEETMVRMWNICRRFHTAAHGITGFHISSGSDRLAVLQHYIGYSPVIDLTGTPAIALYFALRRANLGDECIVYSIDQDAPDQTTVVFTDHAFLLLDLRDGGLEHRWLKQDGYSISPKGWPALDAVCQFDLLALPGVKNARFIKQTGDDQLVRHLGALEEASSDPLAAAVRATFVAVAQSLDLLTPSIQKILEASATA
jgi:hypothetical protein